MAKTLYLEIITPEKQFFTGNVEGIVLPALDGQYGVQPGHEPIVTALEPGNVRYCVDGAWKEIVVTQGFAERAKQRAEERLRQQQSIQEYYHSKAALARAMARLKASGK